MRYSGHPVVHVEVGATNRGRRFLFDLARRQADHLGPCGITAKRGETDLRIRQRGYMRLPFPTRKAARRYMERVERLGEAAVRCRLMRNRQPYSR